MLLMVHRMLMPLEVVLVHLMACMPVGLPVGFVARVNFSDFFFFFFEKRLFALFKGNFLRSEN